MTITGALVLWAVIWFLCLLVSLQVRVTTQREAGRVEPGTSPSAPENPGMWRRVRWVTLVTLVLWLPLVLVIEYGGITVRDLDIFGTFEGRHGLDADR